MAKYMIHTCLSRMWYVQDYLIPSLLNQGIAEEDVCMHVDFSQVGCLKSTMQAFKEVGEQDGSTWHLQDDVIVCSDFKQRTEEWNDADVACGFCSAYDCYPKSIGKVTTKFLWYSFPCILIKNSLAKGCNEWFYTTAKKMELYKLFVLANKYDDTLFNEYMKTMHPAATVYNIAPNLVNHIDYLIGGSVVNTSRAESKIESLYWQEPELVIELAKNLSVDKH